jgi:hypothetical protein
MPDFSMCANDDCAAKANCRRSEASGTKPSEPQWWANWAPDSSTGECDGYWPFEQGNKP